MSNPFTVGDVVRVRAKLKDMGGKLADPTALTFAAKSPASTLSYALPAAQIVRESTGVYYVDVEVTCSGVWFYRFAATGTFQAAREGSFVVPRSNFF